MARKRYKKKRADYRKGGRVNLKHGGKPQRGDFDVADEYRNALDNWYSDPAHRDPVASQLSPQRTTPERMSEISAMPGVPSPTGIKVIDEYNVGLATPPKDNKLLATPTKTQTTVERGQDRKVVGGSKGKDYVPKVVTSGKNNDNKDTRNIYTDATERKITTARTTAEATRKGETIVPTIPKISDAAGTKLDTTIATGDDKIQTIGKQDEAEASKSVSNLELDATTGTATTSAQQTPISVSTMTAMQNTTPPAVDGATGQLSPEAVAQVTEIRSLSGEAVAAQVSNSLVNAAKATNVDGIISAGAFVPQVTGVGAQLSTTADAEVQTREAITGTSASGTASQIINTVGFEAAQRSAVQGTAREGAAASMIAQVADIPQAITAAIVQNPATVEAQIDNEPVQVQAAIAALPTEALVSSQMESLLGGLESGNVPSWARPAVDAVNQNMAERGIDVSTIARDAMFNSIIQSAFPMAQSNAQALQARAAQNLSNEQQANLEETRLDMSRRMTNLANQQQAESQTAQNAQQMAVMQSQFDQAAVMTTAQQQQQTALANLQNQQQAAVLNAQNEQAMNAQNLSVGAQIDLANLQIADATAQQNMSAVQQERLAEYQNAAKFLSQNAAFAQDMQKANLTVDQQTRLANLSALNTASAQNLSAAQQTELANLNKQMQVNLNNSKLAQQMGLAQLNVDQQRAMQNATVTANMDMTKFTTAQQVELANSKFMQTATLTNLNNSQQAILQNATQLAALDMAAVDQRTKIAAQNAQSFLNMDMANLSNEQQASMLTAQQKQQAMLSNQASENAARQFNATSENQTNQFMANLAQQIELNNTAQLNAMEQFNASAQNQVDQQVRGLTVDENKFNAQMATQIDQYNTQLAYDRAKWNATNAQAVEQSNIAWRRQANTINTAAANQIAMQNSQNLFGMSQQAQAFLWQELRDRAAYEFQAAEKFEDRKTHLIAQSLGNEATSTQYWDSLTTSNISKVFDSLVNIASTGDS
jgi:hypothetical protein